MDMDSSAGNEMEVDIYYMKVLNFFRTENIHEMENISHLFSRNTPASKI